MVWRAVAMSAEGVTLAVVETVVSAAMVVQVGKVDRAATVAALPCPSLTAIHLLPPITLDRAVKVGAAVVLALEAKVV
jgi:hypothetical protein